MKFATSFNFAALVFSALLAIDVSSALGADVAVKLTGDQEVPPVASSASGTGTIVIKNDKTVSGSIKTTGIDGIMAHIHQYQSFKDGNLYVNVHSAEHKGGEIRTQLKP
jgi:hypothetical protein